MSCFATPFPKPFSGATAPRLTILRNDTAPDQHVEMPDTSRHQFRSSARTLVVAATAMVLVAGCHDTTSPAQVKINSIATLNTTRVIASTVDRTNGDQNPYGIVVVPDSALTTGRLLPGDILVSNINDRSNTMGMGTTIELIRPSDATPTATTFFSGAASPIALVLNANASSLWIANYGLSPDGTQGYVQVVNNHGAQFPLGAVVDSRLRGSWGQGFNGQPVGAARPPAFFDSNVLTGAVYRLTMFPSTASGPNFAAATITQIAALGHSGTTINNVVGPQGMARSGTGDTLYVTDPVNNRIMAIPQATTTGNVGAGVTVYQGAPLNQPAGITVNPLNGDLLVVNQGDNTLIEIDPVSRRVIASRVLDPTHVVGGTGSALFGVVAVRDQSGRLVVYYVNDNSNTLNSLSQ